MFTKITDADLTNKGVVGLPDTPNLSTTEMQEKFDEIANDVIIPKFNNLVDEMADKTGAENIGAVDTLGNETTVQALLSDIKTNGYTREQADEKFVEKEDGKELTSNDFTDDDKTKLDSLENYVLPIGTDTTLGGVKADNSTFTIDENGVGHAIGGGGSGTADYEALFHKPKINGVSLIGDKSAEDLGLQTEMKLIHIVVTYEADVVGGTITCKNGDEEVTWVADSSLSHTFDLTNLGTWTISEDATDTSETVVATYYGNYAASLGGKVKIVVNYGSDMVGKNITVTSEGISRTKVASGTSVSFSFKPHATYTVTENLNNQSSTVNATTDGTYTVNFVATINTTISDLLIGNTFTCSDGTTTITWLSDASSHIFKVSKFGTWTLTNTDTSATVTVVVSEYVTYTADFGTMSWQGWLESADIPTTGFTDLASVLASEVTLRTLFTKHASVDYLVEWVESDAEAGEQILDTDLCAKWINLRDYALDTLYGNASVKTIMDSVDKYFYGEWVKNADNTWSAKGNVPIMTSNSSPYGEVIYGSNLDIDGRQPYYVFNGLDTNDWNSSQNTLDESKVFIGYKFTNPTNVKKLALRVAIESTYTDWYSSGTFKVLGSNDGSTWELLEDNLTWQYNTNMQYFDIDNDNYYLYYKVVYKSYMYGATGGTSGICSTRLQFYGRELSVSVPTMDGNSSPFGSAFGENVYSSSGVDNTLAYKVFTKDYEVDSYNGHSVWYLGYDFGYPIKLKKVNFKSRVSQYATSNVKIIQGYDESIGGWITLVDNITLEQNKNYSFDVNTENAYSKYRVYNSSADFEGISNLQFFGLDYSEHAERHYIYDNGVEVENCTKTSTSVLSTLDTTDYDLLRATVGMYATTSDRIKCGSGNSNLNGMPNNNYLNISSVNGSNESGFSVVTNTSDISCWLE